MRTHHRRAALSGHFFSPFTPKVLRQNGDNPFQRPQHGSVHHDRSPHVPSHVPGSLQGLFHAGLLNFERAEGTVREGL